MTTITQHATFAGGCFWCTEAMFKRLRGVSNVVSGYTGGRSEHPDYNELHSKNTGHAEAIQLDFDPNVISYEQLVEVFFGTHDPTTLNRQGADVGTEYRSVIFYHNDEQRQRAESVKQRLESEHIYEKPIVTVIEPANIFHPAETEHQNFYDRNPNQPYCQVVINPKLAKLRQKYAPLLKKDAAN